MAAANQSTGGSVGGDAVSDNICIHHTDAERKERIGCPICLRRELAAVTAERDVLRADLCEFAIDMEKQLSALTAERDTKQMEYSRAQEMASKFCAQRDEARAERDALKADLCTFAVDMERQLSASQQEAQRLREALDGIMESAKVAYCATTDPMMTDALVGIGKRCKDAIEND